MSEKVYCVAGDHLIDPATWLSQHGMCQGCYTAIMADVARSNVGQMVKLESPVPCESHLLAQEERQCTGQAYWLASGYAWCDKCIVDCLERTPDNRGWLKLALDDIKGRRLKEGARVRIQYGDETGHLGTVYNVAYGRPAPYHVRPDGWPQDVPGIAYKSEELDILL